MKFQHKTSFPAGKICLLISALLCVHSLTRAGGQAAGWCAPRKQKIHNSCRYKLLKPRLRARVLWHTHKHAIIYPSHIAPHSESECIIITSAGSTELIVTHLAVVLYYTHAAANNRGTARTRARCSRYFIRGSFIHFPPPAWRTYMQQSGALVYFIKDSAAYYYIRLGDAPSCG